jgi:hypothetical protein
MEYRPLADSFQLMSYFVSLLKWKIWSWIQRSKSCSMMQKRIPQSYWFWKSNHSHTRHYWHSTFSFGRLFRDDFYWIWLV